MNKPIALMNVVVEGEDSPFQFYTKCQWMKIG